MNAIPARLAAILLLAGCPPAPDPDDTGLEDVEVLEPEPADAPSEVVDGRWGCLGDVELPPVTGGSVQLTGYVRTLADPTAATERPAAEITAFDEAGNEVGTSFADPAQAGRVTLGVPVGPAGFTGHVVVRQEGFLDHRFQVSRPVTAAAANGWAWLTTAAERDAAADRLGVSPGAGVLVGAVHDCDGFGVANVVITLDGASGESLYVEGFEPVAGRGFTSASGRFAAPDVGGPATVAAWGRLTPGGPLTLLSRLDAEGLPGGVSAVALEPRGR